MCYDDTARPPDPPGTKGSAQGEDIILTAADDNRFMAYMASPEQAGGASVIIFPDVRGLHQFYKDLALRFAEIGISTIAIDYFGRTAGIGSRDEAFEYMPHVQQIRLETFLTDARAALTYLQDKNSSSKPATFSIGFCMGGSLSFISGSADLGLTGVIGFYAGMTRDFNGAGTLLDFAEKITCPALGLFGGADRGIPISSVEAFGEKLKRNGVEQEIVVYPDAPHSFFDRHQAQYAEDSADAWRRVLAFINSHT